MSSSFSGREAWFSRVKWNAQGQLHRELPMPSAPGPQPKRTGDIQPLIAMHMLSTNTAPQSRSSQTVHFVDKNLPERWSARVLIGGYPKSYPRDGLPKIEGARRGGGPVPNA